MKPAGLFDVFIAYRHHPSGFHEEMVDAVRTRLAKECARKFRWPTELFYDKIYISAHDGHWQKGAGQALDQALVCLGIVDNQFLDGPGCVWELAHLVRAERANPPRRKISVFTVRTEARISKRSEQYRQTLEQYQKARDRGRADEWIRKNEYHYNFLLAWERLRDQNVRTHDSTHGYLSYGVEMLVREIAQVISANTTPDGRERIEQYALHDLHFNEKNARPGYLEY